MFYIMVALVAMRQTLRGGPGPVWRQGTPPRDYATSCGLCVVTWAARDVFMQFTF